MRKITMIIAAMEATTILEHASEMLWEAGEKRLSNQIDHRTDALDELLDEAIRDENEELTGEGTHLPWCMGCGIAHPSAYGRLNYALGRMRAAMRREGEWLMNCDD